MLLNASPLLFLLVILCFQGLCKIEFFIREDICRSAGNPLHKEVVEPLLEIILWHILIKGVPKIAASLNVYVYVHIIMSKAFICMYF